MRFSKRALIAGAASLLASPAVARLPLLGAGGPANAGWWTNVFPGLPQPSAIFQFNNDRYWTAAQGPISLSTAFGITRTTTGYAKTASGSLTSFASGAFRRTDKGLLIEGARTNNQPQSNGFGSAPWGGGGMTSVTANNATAPDGTTTAGTAVPTAALSQHGINGGNLSWISGTVYTISVFARMAASQRFIQLLPFTAVNSGSCFATFDLQTGATNLGGSGGIAAYTEAYVNGWYRCVLIFTATATASEVAVIAFANSISDGFFPSVATTGTAVELWNFQVEAGSVATSPIVTGASAATRNADAVAANTPVTSWGLTANNSFFVRSIAPYPSIPVFKTILSFGDGTGNNRTVAYLAFNTNAREYWNVTGGVSQGFDTSVGGNPGLDTSFTCAGATATNDCAFQASGGSLITDNTVTLPTVTGMFPGQSVDANHLFGYVSEIAVWNATRLSNANLTTLVGL